MADTSFLQRDKNRLRIRVPSTKGGYTAMPALTTSPETFLAAIKDALKEKYKDRRAIEDYVSSFFYGPYAVSKRLDPEERLYVLGEVASDTKIRERLFAPSLTMEQLREEEEEKKRVKAVLSRYPRLNHPVQLAYVANCEYSYAQAVMQK